MAAMRVVHAVVLVAFGAAGALAVDRLVLEPASTAAPETAPEVTGSEPGPGDPPVLWLDGTLEEISESELVVREGQGPRIRIERFAAGATSFLRREGDTWRELRAEEADAVAGEPACVEALLDGRTFLALRVFLGSECGPAMVAGS